MSSLLEDGHVVGNRGSIREWLGIAGAGALLLNVGCASTGGARMDIVNVRAFATRYTAAWCSQDPSQVASFFAGDGSLTINAGTPSVGRAAITEAARGFMSAFPDMVVLMDAVEQRGAGFIYRWTLTGTNKGPGGTGRRVRISGYEKWTIGGDGMIARSLGHFDEADYKRQLGTAPATQ